MSEVIVKPEPTEENDEENGRTTPKRKTTYDYEDAEATVLMQQNGTECNKSSIEVQQPQISNDEKAMEHCTTEDSSNNNAPSATEQQQNLSNLAVEALIASSTSTTGVLVKDEPQDTYLAALENSLCGLDDLISDIQNETAVTPPSTPPILPTPSLQSATANEIISGTEQQNILESYLDGTPIVKEEIVSSDVLDSEVKTETLSPCAVISANENTTTLSHPQISLVPTHRLRVKSEFSETAAPSNPECSGLPQDFFEDLLPANAPPPPRIKDEPIPDNFFDDLLVDRIKERIEEAENVELEEKFSDRLKELRELETKKRSKNKKKHKKSKKKSRKRSRSRSSSRDSRSPTPKYIKSKLAREEISDIPSTSSRARSNKAAGIRDDSSDKYGSKGRSSPMSVDDEPQGHLTAGADIELVDETENIEAIQPHLPEIGPHLTAKQKRDRIMIRAKSLIAYLKRVENAEAKPMSSTFLYTSTVRKLPASNSYRNQHIYENRSPLHTINNVSYKFNSHMSQFNFEEWGLASLPPLSAKIAKLVGYDAAAVHNKLKVIKIPAKIRNTKSEGLDEEDEELLLSRSSLFRNITTQTDEIAEIMPRKTKGYDIGVQVQTASFEVSCQTLETESPSIKQFDNSDDLPIMALIRDLNENQLMALHDFAELINQPANNAMDMYRLRQRMLDIYKCSQLPSALATPVPAPGNSYTSGVASPTQRFQQQQQQQLHVPVSANSYMSAAASPSQRYQQQQHQQQQQVPALRIQTVCSADGQRFSANDPRIISSHPRIRGVTNNSAIRNVSPVIQSQNCYDPRNPSFSQRYSGSTLESQRPYSYQMQHQQQQQQSQPPTNNGNKYYGRGGLRR